MKTSVEIKQITASFLKAQKEIESVIKDQSNPFFHSKYATLTAVIDACKAKLNTEGIAILQPIDGMTVETILIHSSGEWFSSSTPIVCKETNNPQALGSAITYAKRYGLQSMVLLPAEDDDGNGAVPASPETKTEPKIVKSTTGEPLISDKQGNLVYARSKAKEAVEELKKHLVIQYGIEHIKDIQRVWLDEILLWIENYKKD
jgi:hypothetical protein